MSRVKIVLAGIVAGAAAVLLVPSTPAGSADGSCVAWGSLPSQVRLAGSEVVVHTTLRTTPACRGVTADAGATATLAGPGPSTSDFPLLWQEIGATDTAHFQASLSTPGTYRISNGKLHTYDAAYEHIPFEWRTTTVVVKYAGRFAGVSHDRGRVGAELTYYARDNWAPQSGVAVSLQRRTDAGTWRTVATHESTAAGRVVFRDRPGVYRLLSAGTRSVSATATGLASA